MGLLSKEIQFVQMREGAGKTSTPPNSVLTNIAQGKDSGDTRWWRLGYRKFLGDNALELDKEESQLPAIVAPVNNGGSGLANVPEGTIVSSLALGHESLVVFYRRVVSPQQFKLGPLIKGVRVKEPKSNGESNEMSQDGCTIVAFEIIKDPDKQLSLDTWCRQVTVGER